MVTQVHILIFPIMKLAKQAAQENPSPALTPCQLLPTQLRVTVFMSEGGCEPTDENLDFVAAKRRVCEMVRVITPSSWKGSAAVLSYTVVTSHMLGI